MYDAYLICTSPRSGSTLLCDLLRQTGVAGWPESFFRPASVPDFAKTFGLPGEDGQEYSKDYINAALSVARGEGRIAGLRFMWDALGPFEGRLRSTFASNSEGAALHSEILGETKYIFLERKDKLAQAISRTRAEQTGLWHRNADGSVREQTGASAPAVYDATRIRHYLSEQEQDIRHWNQWFAQNSVDPFRLSYEDLASNPSATLKDVLGSLNLDPSSTSTLVPGTAKLADDVSQQWAQRFRRDD